MQGLLPTPVQQCQLCLEQMARGMPGGGSLPLGSPSHASLRAERPSSATLPSSVLQMDCCRRSQKRVIPDNVTSILNGTLPPHRSRVNGWSKPFSLYQVVPWAMFLIFVLGTFCVFIPMLPPQWQDITYAVSFYRGSPCLWSGVGRGQSSWSQAEKLLCSILHTESSTGVVSRFPLPTLSTPISRSQTPTHTPVLHVSHWLTVLAERADAHTAVSPLTCPWCRETAPGEEGCRGPRHWGRWRSGPLQLSQGCTGSVRVIQQGKGSLIRKDRSTYSSRLLSPGSVRGVLWSPVPSSDFPGQLSHGWLWRFASEVLPGGRALWGTRRHLPLQLCSVLEGGLESVSVVRSSCDVSPFVGGSQASSPLVAA